MTDAEQLESALTKAAQIMAGTVTYRGYEKDLAVALIKLWQKQPSQVVNASETDARVSVPTDLWEEIKNYFYDRQDTRDRSDGGVAANEEMHLYMRMDQEVK